MPIPVSQINEAQRLILALSAGKYHVRGKVSPNCDDEDSIISGLNMLAEELQHTTVSLDFFSSIYNSASNMIIVVLPGGIIRDTNLSAQQSLCCSPDELKEKHIQSLFTEEYREMFNEAKKALRKRNAVFSREAAMLSEKRRIPVMLTCSRIMEHKSSFSGYLFCIKDISEEKKTEQHILNSIIETQEQEQQRVSFDLHDSLGQEIVNAKTMLSLISLEKNKLNKTGREAIKNGMTSLFAALDQIRSICFNLRPAQLEKYGLCITIQQLIRNLEQHPVIFHFSCPEKLKTGNSSLEITTYRIVQEFITNALKHSEANNIYLSLFMQNKQLNIIMRDDGKGFKMNKSFRTGRGLNNIATRVKAFNGRQEFISKPGKGTELKVQFPVRTKAE